MDDSHRRPRICGIRTSHHAAVNRQHLHQNSFFHRDHGNSGRLCVHAFREGKNGGNLCLRLIDQGVNNDFEVKPTDSFVHSSVYWISLYSAWFGRLWDFGCMVFQQVRLPRRLSFLRTSRIRKQNFALPDNSRIHLGIVLLEIGRYEVDNVANFCVSGVATQWYFYRKKNPEKIKFWQSLFNLFRFHWGSVLGCALVTATLYVFDYVSDFFLVIFLINSEQRHKQSIRQRKLLRVS